MSLRVAGLNGNGDFIIGCEHGSPVIRVPDEWRVPLAAHLLAGVDGLFGTEVIRRVHEIQQRLVKQKGKQKSQYTEDAKFLGELKHSLECLLHEYLDADPKTSTRYEYHPEYYDQRRRKLVAAGYVKDEPPPPPPEEIDDTPLPWEEA